MENIWLNKEECKESSFSLAPGESLQVKVIDDGSVIKAQLKKSSWFYSPGKCSPKRVLFYDSITIKLLNNRLSINSLSFLLTYA